MDRYDAHAYASSKTHHPKNASSLCVVTRRGSPRGGARPPRSRRVAAPSELRRARRASNAAAARGRLARGGASALFSRRPRAAAPRTRWSGLGLARVVNDGRSSAFIQFIQSRRVAGARGPPPPAPRASAAAAASARAGPRRRRTCRPAVAPPRPRGRRRERRAHTRRDARISESCAGIAERNAERRRRGTRLLLFSLSVAFRRERPSPRRARPRTRATVSSRASDSKSSKARDVWTSDTSSDSSDTSSDTSSDASSARTPRGSRVFSSPRLRRLETATPSTNATRGRAAATARKYAARRDAAAFFFSVTPPSFVCVTSSCTSCVPSSDDGSVLPECPSSALGSSKASKASKASKHIGFPASEASRKPRNARAAPSAAGVANWCARRPGAPVSERRPRATSRSARARVRHTGTRRGW